MKKKYQFKGIDGILQTPKTTCLVDEKASLYYINREIPTFAFEINSVQRGRLCKGWLFNREYMTTHYLLIWPNANTTDLDEIQSENFHDTLCMVVPRENVIGFLASCGLTEDRIEYHAEKIRKGKHYGKIPIKTTNDAYYYLSKPKDYEEAPLNIVIRKEILRKLSVFEYRTA